MLESTGQALYHAISLSPTVLGKCLAHPSLTELKSWALSSLSLNTRSRFLPKHRLILILNLELDHLMQNGQNGIYCMFRYKIFRILCVCAFIKCHVYVIIFIHRLVRQESEHSSFKTFRQKVTIPGNTAKVLAPKNPLLQNHENRPVIQWEVNPICWITPNTFTLSGTCLPQATLGIRIYWYSLSRVEVLQLADKA